jgi:uncharacterized protein YlxP (DUF503 family)
MFVSAAQITLRLPESHSLKDKRQIVRSLLQRARNEFQVATSEVGDTERWQIAVLGFAAVSSSASHAEQVITKVERLIGDLRPDLEFLDVQIETFSLRE